MFLTKYPIKEERRKKKSKTELEAEMVPQQEKTYSKHERIYMDGSASGRPGKGLPSRLNTRTY